MEELIPFTIGQHEDNRALAITPAIVQDAHNAGYDMLTTPITTPFFQSRVLSLLSSSLTEVNGELSSNAAHETTSSSIHVPALTPADTPLTPDETISQLIGVTSSWIDLGSPDPIISDISKQVFKLEVAYAAFCGLTYLIVPGPRLRGRSSSDSGVLQFARSVMDALTHGPYLQIYIHLAMVDDPEDLQENMGDLAAFAREEYRESVADLQHQVDLFGTWEAWHTIRSICTYATRICVALSLPKLLPPASIQSRWYSEPVRILTLDAEIFTKNPKGYPVLSRAHQALISRFARLRTIPWFLLTNVGTIPASSNGTTEATLSVQSPTQFPSLSEAADNQKQKNPTPHLAYMRNLQTKQPALDAIARFSAGYQDYLQAPLQPLTVNLESMTYEVFEKDPIKYAWYERAIARALNDWVEAGKPTSNPDGRVVVAVVGAGRGPLVTRALQAAEDTGIEIDMWALEKNPNAYVLLQRHNENLWNDRVSLVHSDMRTWRGPVRPEDAKQIRRSYNLDPDEVAEQMQTGDTYTGSSTTDATYLLATATHQPTFYKIDILISELLGSFADNELSPECLDGVQHLLNPDHGISIPSSYSAFVTPISAPKLHADVLHNMTPTNPHAAEVPYVVMLNAIDYLSTTSAPSSSPTTVTNNTPPPTTPLSAAKSTKILDRPHPSTTFPQPQAESAISPPPHPTSHTDPGPQPLIQRTWSFDHPTTLPSPSSIIPVSNSHNTRQSTLNFPTPHPGVIHGLAGYFEATLYPGVELSTNPNTMDEKSAGMISWFPIFFPLKTPLYVPGDVGIGDVRSQAGGDSSGKGSRETGNCEVRVNMWRMTDERRVWYEWVVDVFLVDTGGRKRRVGGSELHSSVKDACLM